MIYNERQLKISISQLEKLSSAIETLKQSSSPGWVLDAQISALNSQLQSLESEISEYNLLKEGRVNFSANSDLSSLPKTLIQARIAKGLSQKDLADALGMKPQQIQRYEASNYMGASLSRLIQVSSVLEVEIQERWGASEYGGNSLFSWDTEENIDWSKFPIKEMLKRGWLNISQGLSPSEAVRNFFNSAAGPEYATALHRKKFHGSNKPNEFSLIAWQARVLEKAREVTTKIEVPDFLLNDSWLDDLTKISLQDSSPIKAQEYLLTKGIIVVIEPHLPGTYLDGAAMILDGGTPVVALTLRHDRLDNFWFVLLHELGHVFLHLFESLNIDFFDEEDDAEDDELEREADRFALNTLIPEEKWDLCLSRFATTDQNVILDAQNLQIHPSIVAGRIRKEQNNYTILNDLVGQGSVRISFEEHI